MFPSDWPFRKDYFESCSLFRSLCEREATLRHSYVNVDASTSDGDQLVTDIAYFGRPEADNVLIVCSGTHGAEGGCGSGIQAGWLQQEMNRELPENVAVLMIHALNPWGFARMARTTENNVDVNRNFVDFDQSLSRNAAYDGFHSIVIPDKWSEESVAELDRSIRGFRNEVGEQAFLNAMRAGQYDYPEGLGYGGQRPTWSRRVFEEILSHAGRGRSHLAFIDLHTGVGDWGERVVLCFHKQESEALERAEKWWHFQRADSALEGDVEYRGLIFEAVEKIVPSVEVTVICAEFGTAGFDDVQLALSADLWRRFAKDRSAQDEALAADLMQRAFYPLDHAWQDKVLSRGIETINEGVRGLSSL